MNITVLQWAIEARSPNGLQALLAAGHDGIGWWPMPRNTADPSPDADASASTFDTLEFGRAILSIETFDPGRHTPQGAPNWIRAMDLPTHEQQDHRWVCRNGLTDFDTQQEFDDALEHLQALAAEVDFDDIRHSSSGRINGRYSPPQPATSPPGG